MLDTLDPRVLLVAEDDPDDQTLIQDAIAALGINVDLRFVENGCQLLTYLQDNSGMSPSPSLVLLDLNMPVKDGRTALAEMRANPQWVGLPVVVLTTSRAEEDRRFCQRYNVQDYYEKPSSFRELIRILNDVLSQYLPDNDDS